MDEAGRNRLWEKYIASHDSEIREQLIVEYAQLVKLVAGRMNMYLGYNVEYDDLVGYGVFGLIDAIDKFDSGKNVKFETYASLSTLFSWSSAFCVSSILLSLASFSIGVRTI